MLSNKSEEVIIRTLIEEGLYNGVYDGVILEHKFVDKDLNVVENGKYIMGVVYCKNIPSKNGELMRTSRVTNLLEFGKHYKLLTENLITGKSNTYILYNE